MTYVFDPPPVPAVPVAGGGLFPVRRIFCIGRNYADHVREMGGDPKSTPPVFFTKPADALVRSREAVPYPQSTEDFHYEGELVVALGAGGRDIARDAGRAIFGFAAGCDLTRRDLQAAAKKTGGPWDSGKGFDRSAAVGDIARIGDLSQGFLADAGLRLAVNGAERQNAKLKDMIWPVLDIIMALSRLFELKAGDLIFSGTPEGVGPLKPGDRVEVSIDALPPLKFSIAKGGAGGRG
jgi:fumarylpyruvate hydrolase